MNDAAKPVSKLEEIKAEIRKEFDIFGNVTKHWKNVKDLYQQGATYLQMVMWMMGLFGAIVLASCLKPFFVITWVIVKQPLRYLIHQANSILPLHQTESRKKQKKTSSMVVPQPLRFRRLNTLTNILMIMAIMSVLSEAKRTDIPSIEGTASSMQEAQEEIEMLKKMIISLCKENSNYVLGSTNYITTLACALAKRTLNCQYIPAVEHVPVLNDENIQKFNEFNPMTVLKQQLQEMEQSVVNLTNRTSLREKLNG